MVKKNTVEEYVELLTHVSLRGSGACVAETMVNGLGEKHERPAKTWFVLAWAATGIGFGEATFVASSDGLVCDDETMGAMFIEALLVKLARSARMSGR